MRPRLPLFSLALAAAMLAGSFSVVGQDEEEPQREPRQIGLTEKAAAALVQLDVTVTGPEEVIANLTAEDFELRVGGRFIERFIVDRVCREYGTAPDVAVVAGAPVELPDPGSGQSAAAVPPPSPATYVFFFDMPHLTMAGYHRSFELAEELILDLFPGNAQGMIVSTAREMAVVTDLTSDEDELLEGLRRLRHDRQQTSHYAMMEESRIEELLEDLSDDTQRGISTALRFQGEEVWHAQRSLNRVSMVLGRLSGLDPPKAFVYFADTMRRNPGEHYLSYFAGLARSGTDEILASGMSVVESRAEFGSLSLDRILDDASALGIRFYAVEAQGLSGNPLLLGRSSRQSTVGLNTPSASSMSMQGNTIALRDAQDTLGTMAHETGGRRFINGVPGRKIARAIREDLSCLYLISFDPEGLPLDQPMPVAVTPTRPKVKTQTRGRLVIQSESAERTTRLLAAFATSGSQDGQYPIDGRIIPTGFEKGRYLALVQVTIPPTQVVNATWDVGASLVSRGKVREDGSGQVRTATPGVPVIFEEEMEFAPGPFELALVAHETTTDQVLSRRVEGEFPDPDDAPVTIPPLAVVQSAEGAFLRGDRLKKTGAVAMGDHEALKTQRPTAIVGLVCRAKFNKNTLSVKRSITGESSAEFGRLEIPAEGDRCVQFRDLMPAKTMTEGGFRYDVWVYEGENQIAHRSTQFFAQESSD